MGRRHRTWGRRGPSCRARCPANVSAAAQVGVAAAAYLTVWVSLDPSETNIGSALEPVILVSVIGTTGLVVMILSRAREASEIDSLTGVANRRGLDRVLDSAVEETTAAQRTLSLIH